MENNTAQHPVNQQIVVGEPVVSKNHRARQIEQSHIKINIHTFTRQKFYRQSYGLSDNGIRCPINLIAGIYKAVSGTRVNKCGNMERRVRNKWRGQGNAERVGIRKSKHIQLDNLRKGSMQSSSCVEGWGLLSLFLNPRILWLLWLWLGWLRLWL